MLIKITGDCVKFIGGKCIQESLINMSLQLYISYLNKNIVTLHKHFNLFITISQHLEFKVNSRPGT